MGSTHLQLGPLEVRIVHGRLGEGRVEELGADDGAVTVDSDTSTSDTLLAFATGQLARFVRRALCQADALQQGSVVGRTALVEF